MPNIDTKKLSLAARNTKLNLDERKAISSAAIQLKTLQSENTKLKASVATETALRKNQTVKKIIEKEKKTLTDKQIKAEALSKKTIASKDLEISKLQKEITALKKAPTLTALKQDANVKKIVDAEKLKFTKVLADKEALINKMKEDLKVVATKPIGKADFNKFISDSVLELQQSFNSQQNPDSEIIIRDVEIEASVITEMQGNKPVHVVPSRKDMLELDGNNFQKLKYMLSVIPKDQS